MGNKGKRNQEGLTGTKESSGRIDLLESEKRRLEEALRCSEERFTSLVGSLDDVVFTMDLEQRHTGVYGGKLKELDIRPEVFLGKTQREVFGPSLSGVHESANLRALAGESLNYEWEGLDEKGTVYYFLTSLSPLRDASGTIIGIVGVVRNISERKQVEDGLKAYYKGAEGAPDIVLLLRRSGEIIYANKRAEEVYGYKKEELCSLTITDLSQHKSELLGIGVSDANKKGVIIETEHRRKDGCCFPVEISLIGINFNGKQFTLCFIRDTSDRKQAELTRWLYDSRLEALMKLYMMSFDPIEKIVDFALGAGVRLTSSRVGFIALVDEAKEEVKVKSTFKKALSGDSLNHEFISYSLKDSIWGEIVRHRVPIIINDISKESPCKNRVLEDIRLSRYLSVPIFDGGEIVAVAAVGNKDGEYDDYDAKELTLIATCAWGIIQRQIAIEQLKKSEEYFRTLIENSSDPFLIVDKNGSIKYQSPSVERLFSYIPEEVTGENLYKLIHPDDQGKTLRFFTNIKNSPDTIHREELRTFYNNQEIHVFEVMGKMLPVEMGNGSMVINARDITEIKAVEKSLRESESKYHHLFENAGDAIFVADVETGIIIEANKQAEILMGRPASEIIGMHQKDMHPEFDRERCARGFKMVTSSGWTKTVTTQSLFIDNNGRQIPVEICATTFEMDGRRLAQGIFRDITERKRIEEERLEREVQSATRDTQQKLVRLKKLAAQSIGLKEITYKSNKMRTIIQETQKYHQDRSIPILIEGETGTGKEVVVKLIHFGNLDEIETPLVDINCAAISPSLFESELFGYEPGSFTGGLSRGRKGKFELAQGGTLFLDEVSELPLELQAKLLRVIQDKQYYRVGGLKKIKSDVRIICATNDDLEKRVQRGAFRKDLYYRLKVGYIQIPPLRERKEDILPLANMFLLEFSRQRGKGFNFISRDASRILTEYSWPGNVRELKNLIEWVTFRYDDPVLEPFHIDNIFEQPFSNDLKEELPNRIKSGNWVYKGELTAEFLNQVMEMHKGNKSEVARYLGISRPYLYRLLQGINRS